MVRVCLFILQSGLLSLCVCVCVCVCMLVQLCNATIRKETVEPSVAVYHDRVEFVGSAKSSNISILLWNITFEDEGDYICFARNPKEKGRNHSATYTLLVVDQCKDCMAAVPSKVFTLPINI